MFIFVGDPYRDRRAGLQPARQRDCIGATG